MQVNSINQNDTNQPQTRLLRLCAHLDLSSDQHKELAAHITSFDSWSGIASMAERHGLAPLMYRHLKQIPEELPKQGMAELGALSLRHRRAHEIRSAALREVLDTLDQAGIETAVLKGGALSHLIYPNPALRPMRDLDILVSPARADDAQALLRKLGYSAPTRHSSYMRDHHHLPDAALNRDGLKVTIEVHRDALSGDVPDSIRLDNLRGPLQEFSLAGGSAWALGHIDMLRHLCHHSFEPAAEIKLGAVVDIYAYATHFFDDIDWHGIHTRDPFVLNILRCLHFLVPLPAQLHAVVTPPSVAARPRGVGAGMRPLSHILTRQKSLRRIWDELFYPSDWWLHAYYEVAPEQSLWFIRWARHGTRVAAWLLRRARASLRSRWDRN